MYVINFTYKTNESQRLCTNGPLTGYLFLYVNIDEALFSVCHLRMHTIL